MDPQREGEELEATISAIEQTILELRQRITDAVSEIDRLQAEKQNLVRQLPTERRIDRLFH